MESADAAVGVVSGKTARKLQGDAGGQLSVISSVVSASTTAPATAPVRAKPVEASEGGRSCQGGRSSESRGRTQGSNG